MNSISPVHTIRVRPSTPVRTVRFVVPASLGASFAEVVGDFLAWVPLAMDRLDDGSFAVEIRLPTGRNWRYRFLLDGENWINDWAADDYVSTPTGCCVSMRRT